MQKNLNTRDDEIAWFNEKEIAAAATTGASAELLQGAVRLEKGARGAPSSRGRASRGRLVH